MNISQVWPEWSEDCVLGEGSFGKVFRAKRVEYGRTFYSAIKVITVPKNQQEIKHARSQGMNDQDIYNYFRSMVDNLLNEITLMDHLKGAKNVVGIEDYKIIEREGEIGWDIFIRMELLTPFDSFVSNPEFSQLDVIRLGVDLCSALEICELNQIVHRDIKPDNIFISRFGEYKLGDFGIARKLEATQANLSRKGTLNYMAPEVYKGGEYGPNVDIYSLGLVLYTLLNNNRIAFLPPYPQQITYRDNEEALTKRLSGQPLPPPCNASPALGAVIVKACAYRSDERYQSATEFKNDLILQWNALQHSGESGQLPSAPLNYGSVDQKLQSTTNDMTVHGRLVVEEYAHSAGTFSDPDAGVSAYAPQVPESYSTSKSSKVCRVLAFPLALILIALGCVLLFRGDISLLERTVSICLLAIGAVVLLADRNKFALGISVAALSLPYIADGLSVLLGGLQEGFPIAAAISVAAGVLLFFGGIVTLTQKEVRFGGSLCVYAFAVEWLFNIYQMINGVKSVELWHVFVSAAALSVFIWSYGYKSDDRPATLRVIPYLAAFLPAAVALVQAVAFAAAAFPLIF